MNEIKFSYGFCKTNSIECFLSYDSKRNFIEKISDLFALEFSEIKYQLKISFFNLFRVQITNKIL